MTWRNPSSGVTLLETMVALLVMAMTAALLASALGNGLHGFHRSDRITDQVEAAIARRDLRRWLEHAMPVLAPGDDRQIFSGTASELAFLAQPTGGTYWPGQAAFVALGQDGPVASVQGRGSALGDPLMTKMTLGPADTTLILSYWGQRAPDAPAVWHDAWPAGQGLPEAIRISFRTAGPPIASMIVRPGKALLHSEMSLSSLVPPARPSRP